MVIGIISDSHNRLPTVKAALKLFRSKNVGLIVHCGDWMNPETLQFVYKEATELRIPITGVLGNNDKDINGFMDIADKHSSEFVLSEGVLRFEVDNISCAAYHGHHKPTLKKCRDDPSIELLFVGHTHKPLIEEFENKLIINPGSTAFSIPRSKTWKPTVAIYDTNTKVSELLEFAIPK